MSHDSQPLPSLGAAAGLLADVLRPGDEGSEAPGDVIGVYRLIEKIGEGGFGVVWRAEQTEPIKREVALKIIKLGMDTLEVMRRFEQERQALALMDHPNIASVFNAGATPEGRPFFVMELVRGVPVTQYCIEKALPLAARLSLFKEICSGVQHAHQKGVIHRDLKPSNVLVTELDGVPVPKIIDFGIAKATTTDSLTALTLVTRVDQMMGTPLYMSPEQAAASADIDTRSDVYALGVLLYELLTGQPPFDAETLLKAGMEEMRRIIREVEPKPPSRRNDEARMTNDEVRNSSFGIRHSKDLDLITLRALEKDRARRYESASALGEDIQRFLNHEPIHARPPSMAYVAQRWVRRHRAVAVAALVCLLAIVGGAGVALWQAQEARHQAREADAALGVALEALSSTVELDKGRIAQLKMMIDRAATKAATLAGTPQRMTELHFVLAKAYRSLLAPEPATRELRLALAAAAEGTIEPTLLAEMHSSLATALIENDDFKGALPMARLALRELEALDKPAFIKLTESAAGPRSLEVGRQVKMLIEDLRGLSRLAEAKAEVARWLARLKNGQGNYVIAAETVFLAAGGLYEQTEDWQAALDAQRAAMAIRKGYLPEAWTLDYSKVVEGYYLSQMKRYDEALPLIQEGIAALEAKKGKDESIESKWLPMAREKLKAAEAAAGK